MHSVLFAVQIPRTEPEWRTLLAAFFPDGKQQAEGVLRLADNVWILDAHKALPVMAQMIASAARRGVPYGILQFADPPQWLPGGFDPMTILGQSAD